MAHGVHGIKIQQGNTELQADITNSILQVHKPRLLEASDLLKMASGTVRTWSGVTGP